MFRVFSLGNWSGVGGTRNYQFAESGLDAVRFREQHGLPPGTDAYLNVIMDDLCDRRAAESWPEALDSDANLPHVRINNCPGRAPEFTAMLAAGIVVLAGPEKDGDAIGIRCKITCSPFELVQWRRAWAAEQRAKEAEAKLAELHAALERDAIRDAEDEE